MLDQGLAAAGVMGVDIDMRRGLQFAINNFAHVHVSARVIAPFVS